MKYHFYFNQGNNVKSYFIRLLYFALSISEMGLNNLEIFVIILTIGVFPILFFIASKNLDAKSVFQWMMEKPNDWVGKNK